MSGRENEFLFDGERTDLIVSPLVASCFLSQIPLGVRRADGAQGSLVMNPKRESEWKLESGDQGLVLASYAETNSDA